MGDTVNKANHLCDLGDRNRNSIVVCDEIYRGIADHVSAERMEASMVRRAKNGVVTAYEVTGARWREAGGVLRRVAGALPEAA
jgi:hypothetical protein